MTRQLLRASASFTDGLLCAMMNSIQWRLRHLACSARELNQYLDACESLDRDKFYAIPKVNDLIANDGWVEGSSAGEAEFTENERFRAKIFWHGGRPNGRPTVLLLHALMSASPRGYYAAARRFNAAGWNAVFPHLPFHYSRVPRGYTNGALAITANLIRNGETLRRAVCEGRQLMCYLRAAGVSEFGMLGTSYGGWVGALLASIEPGWRFLALLQPIVDVHHAIWQNPVSRSIRKILLTNGISPEDERRHAHLSSPSCGTPLADPRSIVLCAGEFDSISPPDALQALAISWNAPDILSVPQGHFGYRAMRATLKKVEPFL